MNLLDFIKIQAINETSELRDFCNDILRDKSFPFSAKNSEQLIYLNTLKVKVGDLPSILKEEYEKYLLNPEYEKENLMKTKGIEALKFKSGSWEEIKKQVIFDEVGFVGDGVDFYKAYLISNSSDLALFMELNNPMAKLEPRLIELNLILPFTQGDLIPKHISIEIFERLLISTYPKNKFLINKGLQLLKTK